MYPRSIRAIILLIAASSLVGLLTGCGGGDEQQEAPTVNLPLAEGSAAASDRSADGTPVAAAATPAADTPPDPTVDSHPVVVFTTSEGAFKVELDREKAPITVENFLANYVDKGYYDNTIFHQVEKGFMILGGVFTPDLQAKPARAEIFSEAHNKLKNLRGTIAMARDPAYPHSASNQFFFNLVDNPGLDHVSRESAEDYGYCVFGKIIEGLEVLDKIAAVPVESRENFTALPVKTVVIQSVRQVRQVR